MPNYLVLFETVPIYRLSLIEVIKASESYLGAKF
jgi:hypothetical protein